MSVTTILKEKNPKVAEFCERWQSKYQRSYDFSKNEDKADFYEAMLEMARHIATNSTTASLESEISTVGVSGIRLNAFGSEVKPSI